MKRYTVDIIMSLSLFMIFVICCFMLLLFQINGYHDIQYDSDNLYTVSSYLQTALRQGDREQAVSVQKIQGVSCLVIEHEEGISYYYVKDGTMMELFQSVSLPVDLSMGEKRFQIDQWELAIKDQFIQFELMKDDQHITMSLALHGGVTI